MSFLNTYKRADQVRVGDWVYGPNMDVSRLFRVTTAEPALTDEYKTTIVTTQNGGVTSQLWANTAVLVRRRIWCIFRGRGAD